MNDRKKKTIVLNTLTFVLCAIIVALFCISPKEEQVLDKYKVIFDTDGGSVLNALEIEDGKLISMPDTPTRDGYEFVGWMLGDELYDFSEEVSEDITLKAAWKKIDPEITYYTITFDSAGGTTIGNIILEAGKIPVEPVSPTRDGYEFVGWYLNGNLFDFNQPLNDNVNLVAQWVEVKVEEPEEPTGPTEPSDPNKTYTVKFNLNGGTGSIASQTVKAGGKVTRPANPARSGYTFNGWLLNSAKGKAYNFNSKVNSNITLYASWKAIPTPARKYAVRFLSYDGRSVISTINVDGGKKASAPAGPNRAFYKFNGWFTSQTGGTNVNSTTINQSMDFYAQYSKSSITVSCPPQDNGVGGAGVNCILNISLSGGGYLPSTAGITIGKTYYKNGSSITTGQYKAQAKKNGISVCESSGSQNCEKASTVNDGS